MPILVPRGGKPWYVDNGVQGGDHPFRSGSSDERGKKYSPAANLSGGEGRRRHYHLQGRTAVRKERSSSLRGVKGPEKKKGGHRILDNRRKKKSLGAWPWEGKKGEGAKLAFATGLTSRRP